MAQFPVILTETVVPLGSLLATLTLALYVGRKDGTMTTRIKQLEDDVRSNGARIGDRVTRVELARVESAIRELHTDLREIRNLLLKNREIVNELRQ